MDGNHYIITYNLHDQENVIKYYALIDCGTTSYVFIDEDYTHHYHLPLHLLRLPKNLLIIDGQLLTSGAMTYIVHTPLMICNHTENIPLFITKLEHYPIVLEIPGLQ
jgi:hypothetical protein